MARLEGPAAVADFDPYTTNSTATHNLGQEICLADGRKFRYAKAGASGISAGKLQLAPTPKTNHHNVAWASGGALNATSVTVTLGATAATANEYAEGYVVVNDATGEGTAYKVKSHPAADASATLELELFDPIKNDALVSGSEMTLVHNSYNGVVEGTSTTQKPAGVPLADIAAGEFGWLQSCGIAPLLCAGTIEVGNSVVSDGTTAGAVAINTAFVEATDANRDDDQYSVGRAVIAGVSTEYRPVYLQID